MALCLYFAAASFPQSSAEIFLGSGLRSLACC